MSAVVVELQREALDRSIRVSDLLRKALVVARKLSLAEFQRWIERELNGYGDSDSAHVPDYRKVQGQVRGWNPYRGWIPVMFESAKEAELLSERSCGQSIAELENLIDRKESDSLHMPFPPALQTQISRGFGFTTEVSLFMPPTAIVRIVDAVRTVVLNWAIKLEEEGVLGEGMSFTGKEKEAASRAPQNIANFFGPVQSLQIQQGAVQSVQMASLSLDTGAVRAFVQLLRGELDKLELPPDQKREAEAELRTVEAQVESPKPKPSIVRESLGSLKSILEKGGGAAIGHLLIELGKVLF